MKNLNESINRVKKLMGLNESQSVESPLDGQLTVTSPFGAKRSYETHPGVDLRAKTPTDIKSPLDGTILIADMNYNSKCGGTIDIQHSDGLKSRFCHVSQMNVKKGDVVKQGQVLGKSGGDANDPGHGNSKNRHLHWTLMKDGKTIDPMKYLGSSVSTSTQSGDTENIFTDGSYYGNFIKKFLSQIFPTLKEDYSKFGNNVAFHTKDILIPSTDNEKIKSPVSGVIKNYTYRLGCKNQVSIMHKINDKTYYLEYCGIKNVQVSKGEKVSVNTVLGTTDTDVEVYFYNESGKKQYVDDMLKNSSKSSVSTRTGKVSPITPSSGRRGPITQYSQPRDFMQLSTEPRSPITSTSTRRGIFDK